MKVEKKLEKEKIAASWWAEEIRKINIGSFDNGAEIGCGHYMAAMLAAKMKPTEEDLAKFEKTLAKEIKKKSKALKKPYDNFVVSVDYEPDNFLGVIAQKSGIYKKVFPWKTVMWIYPHEIRVRRGYSNEVETIYSE